MMESRAEACDPAAQQRFEEWLFKAGAIMTGVEVSGMDPPFVHTIGEANGFYFDKR
jgi:hypothetical protein